MSPKNKRKTIRGVMPFLEIEHSENVSGCIQLDTTRTRNIVLTSALYFGCRFSLNKNAGRQAFLQATTVLPTNVSCCN
ncbi:hypothetical protein OUZ56_029275 [Daphnia magna]|uniref:Uncharacterized protein n=1 Tax=Daphnia magna TaxID=35525 RepID=A0ABR0B6C2_9CRUS|nr:hypothetical protein OUZ56_029275 [Daphnia magna]